MTNGLWRTQLALVWAFGLAVFFFLFGLLGGPHGGDSNSVYDMVYAPLGEGQSARGSLAHPIAWLTVMAMVVAWLSPLLAAFLAWRGRRALKGEGEQALRDRIRAGTVAAFVIALSYLTPVGWTLVYGLTRWTMMNIWGEGPDAAQLG
ncbi:hypothetical protein [Micromonospora sp. NBC_01638]|uniref:hypothetical protein n=1 Tax=Micromonospora sp. NBC_01638 TaxID=2975982 RepID=UPI003870BACF|nr:hypothetical protein OG811_10790 [Micromonospora sp. NBC_01638]